MSAWAELVRPFQRLFLIQFPERGRDKKLEPSTHKRSSLSPSLPCISCSSIEIGKANNNKKNHQSSFLHPPIVELQLQKLQFLKMGNWIVSSCYVQSYCCRTRQKVLFFKFLQNFGVEFSPSLSISSPNLLHSPTSFAFLPSHLSLQPIIGDGIFNLEVLIVLDITVNSFEFFLTIF